tara:strand:+ start:9688 stop:9831 length:144 start_codon:yes stop_codon:yes gene_type:complete
VSNQLQFIILVRDKFNGQEPILFKYRQLSEINCNDHYGVTGAFAAAF